MTDTATLAAEIEKAISSDKRHFVLQGAQLDWVVNALRAQKEASAEIERLRAVLEECADDLHERIEEEYQHLKNYRSGRLKHTRDMDIVVRARALAKKP